MKISVSLCTYMGERFLREQLDSILNQTLPVQEIVIGDDHSTDNTINIIKEYQNVYPELIKYWVNDHTIGSVKNFETTIQRCKGDYIFLSDQDDIWMPDKVKVITDLFVKHPDVNGFFSDAELMDDNGKMLGGTLWESIGVKNEDELMANANRLFRFILMLGNIATGATLAFRSSILSQIIPFNLTANSQHDQSIALELSRDSTLIPIKSPLIKYRIHSGQQVGTASKEYWDYNFTIKKRIWDHGFLSISPMVAMDKVWAYYSRSLVYCNKPELQPIIAEAYNAFREVKKCYLNSLSFFQRKKVLLNWYRRSLFSTSIFEVIFE